jgi:hypothetical protein
MRLLVGIERVALDEAGRPEAKTQTVAHRVDSLPNRFEEQ